MTGVHVLTFAVPSIAFLFALLFFGIWTRWKELRYLVWLGFAFLLFGAGILSQILLLANSVGANAIVSCTLYTAAALVFSEGNLRRFDLRPSYLFNTAVAVLTIGGVAYFYYRVAWLDGRVYALNFGLALILIATALRMHKRAYAMLDRVLVWSLFIFALHFFPRTFLTVQNLPDNRNIAQIRQYALSPFWVWMNFSFLIFTVLIGLALSSAVVSDIIAGLTRKATTDFLTGLFNRSGFEEFAEKTTARTERSLIFLDLDNFKSINDVYGHHAGDVVLKKVGSVLRDCLRSSEGLARLGGEEFAVLICDLSPADVWEIAERLRRSIAEAYFGESSLIGVSVTASIGVVDFQPGETLTQALHRADELMYIAKDSGKNRVVSHWTLKELSNI